MYAETRPIPAVDHLDQETFRSCHAEGRPLIVRGAVRDSKAFATWSSEYFVSLFGDRKVSLFIKDRDAPDYSHNEARKEWMELHRAVELMRGDRVDGRRHHYLQNKYIPEEFPELADDLELPPWIDRPELLTKFNLWYGGAGNVTPLHFDPDNNFLAQIRGSKHLTLFDPRQFDILYPDMEARQAFISKVDIVQPDWPERFPLVRQARALEGLLEPGDVLYIPPFWWHLVRSLEESMSVNFWWKAHIGQLLCPAALYYVPEAFDAGVLIPEMAKMDTRGFDGPLDVARFFLDHDHAWVAALLAAAAAEERLAALCEAAGLPTATDGRPHRLPQLAAALAAAGEETVPAEDDLAAWLDLVGRARGKADDLPAEAVAALIAQAEALPAAAQAAAGSAAAG